MSDTIRLSDVPVIQVPRLSTGYRDLDLAYGTTVIRDAQDIPVRKSSGLPLGGVSLWSGSPGVGKTRAAIAISVSVNRAGKRVMFVQTEVTASQFRSWTGNKIVRPDDYLVHTSPELDSIIKAIMRFRPDLIVLDSLNMIDGYQSPTVIRRISERFKKAVESVQGHVIIIGHLNKEGRVKGNNDIEYLIDIQCSLTRFEDSLTKKERQLCDKDISTWFMLTFEKNRYGATAAHGCQNYVMFRHVGDGIKMVTSNFAKPTLPEDATEPDLPEPPDRKRWWQGWSLFGRSR